MHSLMETMVQFHVTMAQAGAEHVEDSQRERERECVCAAAYCDASTHDIGMCVRVDRPSATMCANCKCAWGYAWIFHMHIEIR
jgi:hypothetical protein